MLGLELQRFPRKRENGGAGAGTSARRREGRRRLVGRGVEKGVQVPDPSSPRPRALGSQASWSQEVWGPGFGNVKPIRAPEGSAWRLMPEWGHGEERGGGGSGP